MTGNKLSTIAFSPGSQEHVIHLSVAARNQKEGEELITAHF